MGVVVMKPGASEFCSLCPECSKTHLRASSISKKFFRLPIARHEGRETGGRGGGEECPSQNVSHGDANDFALKLYYPRLFLGNHLSRVMTKALHSKFSNQKFHM
jgi:hypothetical protein